MIAAFLRTVTAGLLLAGVIHVVAVLSIPEVAPDDAVDRVLRAVGRGTMTPIPADGSVLSDLDPFFVHAACGFDAADGPVEVAGSVPDDVWTLVVLSGAGAVVGSLERGGVPGGKLDLVIGTAADVERTRLARAEQGLTVTTVETGPDPGFVMIRAFGGPGPEGAAALAGELSAITCRPPG